MYCTYMMKLLPQLIVTWRTRNGLENVKVSGLHRSSAIKANWNLFPRILIRIESTYDRGGDQSQNKEMLIGISK